MSYVLLRYRVLYDERLCAIVRLILFFSVLVIGLVSVQFVPSLSLPEKVATSVTIASVALLAIDVFRAIARPTRTMSSQSGDANFEQFLTEALSTLRLAEREFRFVTLLPNPGLFVMGETYSRHGLDRDMGFIQAMTSQVKRTKKQIWIHQVYPPIDQVLKILRDVRASPDREPADLAVVGRAQNKAVEHLKGEANVHNLTRDKFVLSESANIVFAMAIADEKVAVIGLLDRTKANPLESMHAGFIVTERQQVNQWKEMFDQLYPIPDRDFSYFLRGQARLAASVGQEAGAWSMTKYGPLSERLAFQRLCLVSPSVPTKYRPVSRTGCYPPLTLLTLAAYVHEKLPQVDIQIINGQTMPVEDIIKEIQPGSLVGISCHILDYENATKIAQCLHDRDGDEANVVIGGPYPSVHRLAPMILANQRSVKYIIRGYGESPLVEILRGKGPEEIPNLYYRASDGVIKHSQRSFSLELDQQPLLCKDVLSLVDMNHYFLTFQHRYSDNPKVRRPAKRGFAIASQRGCLFRERKGPCVFCSTPYRNWRRRPPEHVWDEISNLAKDADLRVDFVWDVSESFTADADYLRDFASKRPRDTNVRFLVYSRVSDLTDDTVELLAEIGCYQVFVGFESGDNDILARAKKDLRIDQSLAAVLRLERCGIRLFGAFVLGIEGETEQSAEKTLTLAKRIADTKIGDATILEEVSCSILMPIPGSPAFDDKPELVAKYGGNDVLNLLALKKDYVSRYCAVSYDRLENIREEILRLGAVSSCFAEPA